MAMNFQHRAAAIATYTAGVLRAVRTYEAESATAEQLAAVKAANHRQAQRRYEAKRKGRA